MNGIIKKILQVKEILFVISAIIVAILNLWLGTRLFPFTQSINSLETKVLANEGSINSIKSYADSIKEDVIVEVKDNRQRIDKIYNLLFEFK